MTSAVTLRPFQERALQQYRVSWKKATSHLGIAPTAFGKTIFMGWMAKLLVPKERFRFVVIAHREALVAQNADKIRRVAPGLKVDIEQADQISYDDSDVVSASIQTLRGKRLDKCVAKWRGDGRPIFLIIDEAHHALAPSYQTLIEKLRPDRHLGLTATPFRPDDEDGTSLAQTYPELAFKIPRGEMIDEKWLAEPWHFLVKTAETLAGIKRKKGDYVESELAERLNVVSRNQLVLNTAKDAADILRERGQTCARAVCFSLSVPHAYELERLFREMGWDAYAISAETPIADRRAADSKLKTATGNTVLISYGVLTEGWDVEEVNLGLFTRPTKSGVLADQMLGRVLRFHTDKPGSLVIDFEDEGADDRVSIASTFNLPPGWDGYGESLRNDETWFKERVDGASYTLRKRIWQTRSREQVEEILAGHAPGQPELLPGRGWIWWDLGREVRMIVQTMSIVVFRNDLGDWVAEQRHGELRQIICKHPNIEHVLSYAESFVEEQEAQEAIFLRLGRDNGEPPSDAQLRHMDGRGVPRQAATTKREARLLINQSYMEEARSIEQGVVGFGKHKGTHVKDLPTNYMRFILGDDKFLSWMQTKKRPEIHMFQHELARRGR